MHGARKYKTAVTDYEGLQGTLDTHAAQGWKLLSLTPDTWRRNSGSGAGLETAPFEQLEGASVIEYSASYYLLVFERDDNAGEDALLAALEEPLTQDRPLYEL